MPTLKSPAIFNNPECLVEGWYWALRSAELKPKTARGLVFLGRELVVYRGASGMVSALDAFCPHMGAHLKEGMVEGDSLRCLFHYWKFDARGNCVEIPCQEKCDFVPALKTWPVMEKYGLIWIWAGKTASQPVPFVPELKDQPCAARLGNRFVKNCHPNVVMINAIDAQHFNSVHNLPVDLDLQPTIINENCIEFRNTTQVPQKNWMTRFLARFYQQALTYELCYWFGSTGTVTLGPDFLHFHIMFALRPTPDGKTEGQTLLITRERPGMFGPLINFGLLILTQIVSNYFAKGDTLIFESIRFHFQTPIKADSAIIQFIQHLEQQSATTWGKW